MPQHPGRRAADSPLVEHQDLRADDGPGVDGSGLSRPESAALAAQHVPLVGLVVGELLSRTTGGVPREALAAAGLDGLDRAAHTWSPERDGPFSRFARSVVRASVVAAARGHSAAAGSSSVVASAGSSQATGSHADLDVAGNGDPGSAGRAGLRDRLAAVLGRRPGVWDEAAALGVPRHEAATTVREPHAAIVDEIVATP